MTTNSLLSIKAIALAACSLAVSACVDADRNTPVAQVVANPIAATRAADCAAIGQSRLPGVVIVSAAVQAEGTPIQSSGLLSMMASNGGMTGPVASGLPAFCRVVGSIRPERGSDIGFEVWLPSDRWNGRLYGAGIGGFAGSIDYMALGSAVRGGQVGVATDTGHKSTMQQSGWAKGHPERVRDYGWRAVHLSTITAKALARQFYGRGPDRSYFVGCSGGGRQGLMEAARFPDDYDGIVSSAPAASLTDLTVTMLNSVQAQLPAGAAIRPQQASLIQEEVLKQCDAGDGQVDGLVEDPRQCRFDVAKLACGTSTSPLCLSAPQVSALAKIYAGPRDASGRQLTAAYLPGGSEVGTPFPGGWETYILKGTAPTGGEALAGGFLMDFVQRPFTTPATFDFTKDPQRLKAALSRDLDAPHDLRRFFARGGKLILWHGWADAAIPPEATLRYHAEMLRQSGARAKDAVQLYMVPGVQHCGGGLGATSFGQMGSPQAGDTPARSMVTALRSWVEEDSRPGPLVARRGAGGMFGVPAAVTERQRLLCPWPGRAVLRPGADPDQASSYSCRGGDGAQ